MQVGSKPTLSQGPNLSCKPSGKTVLFSSIVDGVQVTNPRSQAVYFYCKNRDPVKRSFDKVASSLIAQLLRLNLISLDHVYEVFVKSGKPYKIALENYRDILENISMTPNQLFIGIDGLDECEEGDRSLILSLMKFILHVSSPQGNVRILVTSQREKDVEQSMKSAIRFDIEHHHVKEDIQNYVQTRFSRLFEKWEYNLEQQKCIIRDVSNRPEGKLDCDAWLRNLTQLVRHVSSGTVNHGQPHESRHPRGLRRGALH